VLLVLGLHAQCGCHQGQHRSDFEELHGGSFSLSAWASSEARRRASLNRLKKFVRCNSRRFPLVMRQAVCRSRLTSPPHRAEALAHEKHKHPLPQAHPKRLLVSRQKIEPFKKLNKKSLIKN
jgi:hypothetical protein